MAILGLNTMRVLTKAQPLLSYVLAWADVPATMGGTLRYRASETPNVWLLDDTVCYADPEYGDISALPGTPTDGASIPRLLWGLAGPPLRDARVAGPSGIHDLLYYLAGMTQFSRRDADIIFARALRANGVSFLKVLAYYLGVRAGGWLGWRAHRRDPAFQAEMMGYLWAEAPGGHHAE